MKKEFLTALMIMTVAVPPTFAQNVNRANGSTPTVVQMEPRNQNGGNASAATDNPDKIKQGIMEEQLVQQRWFQEFLRQQPQRVPVGSEPRNGE